MNIATSILYFIAKKWPSPKSVKHRKKEYNDDYHYNYALKNQFLLKLSQGIHFNFYNKNILEIGCGHGGISTLFAINGANKVVGIDINKENLQHAKDFSKKQSEKLGTSSLVTEFLEMSAYDLKFKDNTFDVVLADNVFEHFMQPQKVLSESCKVLKPGGKLIIPVFSSIYSKYALHLKTGLKVPWSNLFFSERTIVQALYKLAEKDSSIFQAYPGLKNKPLKVRDVRAYGDLNDITYKKFKKMALEEGFEIESFNTIAPKGIKLIAAIIRKIPIIRHSLLADIFSTGAKAVLVKK